MTTIDTTPSASNGHVPDERSYADHAAATANAIEQQAKSLHDLYDAQEDVVTMLETMLASAKEDQKRLKRALSALEDEAPARTGPKSKQQTPPTWTPSDETLKRVMAALIEHTQDGDAISPTALDKRVSGLSGESIRRGLDTLRERELVRIAGKAQGGGKLWLPMPNVSADDV